MDGNKFGLVVQYSYNYEIILLALPPEIRYSETVTGEYISTSKQF